jgi:hypothetical protein
MNIVELKRFERYDRTVPRCDPPISMRPPQTILAQIDEIATTTTRRRTDVMVALLRFALERYQECQDSKMEELYVLLWEIRSKYQDPNHNDELDMRRLLHRLEVLVLTDFRKPGDKAEAE